MKKEFSSFIPWYNIVGLHEKTYKHVSVKGSWLPSTNPVSVNKGSLDHLLEFNSWKKLG